VIDTSGMHPILSWLGMSFIVAVPVECNLIGRCIIVVISVKMIDFNQIALPKRQLTPLAFSLLPLKKLGELSS
jgi:hypothetical protein